MPSSLMRPSTVRPALNQAQGFQSRPTLFVPPQLQRAGVRPATGAQGTVASAPATVAAAAVISNKPVLYKPDNDAKPATSSGATKTTAVTPASGPAAKKTKVEPSSVKQASSSVNCS